MAPSGEVSTFYQGFQPYHLAIDKDDNLYGVRWGSGTGMKFTPSGTGTLLGSVADEVRGFTIDPVGNLYFSVSKTIWNTGAKQNLLLKMTPTGAISTYAGADEAAYVDANGASARFNDPQGLTSDSMGNIFVVDAGNSVIRKIDTSGNVTTYAGNGEAVVQNGTRENSSFQFRVYVSQPEGLVISKSGRMFVGERYGVGILRSISGDGAVTTYCGNGGVGATIEGPCSESPIYQSGGLATDQDGDVYFFDSAGNLARVSGHFPVESVPTSDF